MLSSSRSRVAAVAALAGCLAASPASAEARDLFRVPTPSEVQSAAQSDGARPGETRRRTVSLAGSSVDPVAARVDQDRPSLRIRLFPGVEAVLDRIDEEDAGDGAKVLNGEGADGSNATLVVSSDRVTGRVRLDGRLYRISPAGGGVHHIAEIDRAKLPPVGPERLAPARRDGRPAAAPDAAAAKRDTVITILFAYTERAKKAAKDIDAEIKLAVALSNRTYKASGVRIRLKLVGKMLVEGYDETKRTYGETLDDLTYQKKQGAPFAAVGKQRDRKGADLVALLREGGSYCGLAWVAPEPGPDSADFGYSETSRDCIEADVVAHELGHNMGLLHDRYVEGRAPKSAYNFGYVNLTKKVRDIMSYSDQCDAKDVRCETIPRFSSPDDAVKGQPFGVPKGKAGAADAARRLDETREGVASYRADK